MLGDLGEGSRKAEFTLDWILSGSGSNSMIGYLPTSYLEGKMTSLRGKQQE